MADVFNLLHEHWLPVVLSSGQRDLVRLCDISRPDIVRISTGRPDCDVSLIEFLIGMLAVAVAPSDDGDWQTKFLSPPSAEHLQTAFAPFAEALVLDGDGPGFFQDHDKFEHEGTGLKRTEQLFLDAPGEKTIEENADHFVKRGAVSKLTRAGAAVALVCVQSASTSGGPGKMTSVRGGGPLTTLIVPGGAVSLWRLLWANTPSGFAAGPDELPKVFPWLVPTRQGGKRGLKTAPDHVHAAQVFFGMPRRIRLKFDTAEPAANCDFLVGVCDTVVASQIADRQQGTDYEGWSNLHPLSPFKRKNANDVFTCVHLGSSRVGYREWLYFAIGDLDANCRLPATCITSFTRRARTLRRLDRSASAESRVWAAGYVTDKAKALDFGDAIMPLVVASTEEAQVQIRRQANALVDAADEVASELGKCVRLGLYGPKAKADVGSSVLQPVRDRFWADTESGFFDTLREAVSQIEAAGEQLDDRADKIATAVGAAWIALLRRHALTIFDDTVPLDAADTRRIGDIIQARRNLLNALTGHEAAGGRIFSTLDQPKPTSAKPAKGNRTTTGATP